MKQLFLPSLLAIAASAAPVTGEPIRNWFSSQLNALVQLDQSPGTPPPLVAERPVPPKVVTSLDDCNVTWDLPGGDSFGSMPPGNGDVGANVWVEDNGDLVFYLSKVDAPARQFDLFSQGR
jgi:hypothetical protein